MGNLATGFKNLVDANAAESKFHMANALTAQGKWQEAEEMLTEVLEVRTRALGEEHQDTLHSKNNLAVVLQDQGKWQEAEEMNREVLEVRSRVLGEEHPDTLRSKNNLALALGKQGKWEEAEEMFREGSEASKKVLGPDHQDTLHFISNVAVVLQEQGNWQEAEELCAEVLDTRIRVLGKEHRDTLRSMINLVNVLQAQGDWQEAEEMYREVLEVMSRVLGEEHPDTLTSKNNLANALQDGSKWQEAEDMYREVLEARKRVLGDHHPDTLQSMESLANAVAHRDRGDLQFRYSLDEFAHFGRLGYAINKLRTSIAARTLRADDEHPDLLKSRMYLAALLIQMNEERGLKESEDLLRQTVPALQKKYGFMNSLTLGATRDLVFLLEEKGKDAEEWRQHLPHVEEKDFRELDSKENFEDCEDPEVAELVRDFLAKPHLRKLKVVSSLSSGSTPAAAQDAASAPTSWIAPSQVFHVVSEAASESDRASDARSSDSSAWLEAAFQQKLHERSQRVPDSESWRWHMVSKSSKQKSGSWMLMIFHHHICSICIRSRCILLGLRHRKAIAAKPMKFRLSKLRKYWQLTKGVGEADWSFCAEIFNMEPENRGLEDDFAFKLGDLFGSEVISRGVYCANLS